MADQNTPPKEKPGLIRQLSLFDSSMMLMGIIIGSGIYMTTGDMAQHIPSAGLLLLAWVVGGLLALFGALSFAELGAAMPQAGGQYIYLREAYSPLWGYLFGWMLFFVAMGGSIATLGAAFARYVGYFLPALGTDNHLYQTELNLFGATHTYTLSVGHFVAVAAILVLSFFNYIGVVFGKWIQNIITAIKIGTLLLFIILGLTIGKTASIDFHLNPTGLSFGKLISGFGIALIAVFWAYDGWHNLNYVTGEIKNPSRNLPLAVVLGTFLVILLYVLMNYVYLLAMPAADMAGVERIAERTGNILFGENAATWISAAVLISVFGALNGAIFVAPRVYYAMAKDGLFFKKVAQIHPRFRTPAFAIIIQAVWASLLALSGTFEQLYTYVIFATILFAIATVAAVFTMRKTHPDMPRPYKAWGYPVIPIIFIAASTGICINTLIDESTRVPSVVGLIFVALGIPVYYYWKRKSNQKGVM